MSATYLQYSNLYETYKVNQVKQMYQKVIKLCSNKINKVKEWSWLILYTVLWSYFAAVHL